MVYTARGEMESIRDQLSFRTTYLYDPVGRTSARQFPSGDVTSYLYDPNGRQTSIRYMDDGRVTFAYDETGNRIQMQDETGATTYAYDPNGRMEGKTTPMEG